MLPRVIVHVAVSADGRIDHFSPDLGQFYGVIGEWNEDTTLAGSETILRAMAAEPRDDDASDPQAPAADPTDKRPLLVMPDSRGRVRTWSALRKAGFWRAGVALVTRATPHAYLEYLRTYGVDHLLAGDDRVDLRFALEELNARYGVRTVRVDGGGNLNGVLLRAGLVHEVSVLVHPCLVGGTSPSSFFRAPDLVAAKGVIPMQLITAEPREGDIVWLRYTVGTSATR